MAKSYSDPDHTADDKAPPVVDPGTLFMHELVSAMEAMAALVPGAHAMGPRFAAMHARLDDMISPDKK